MGRRLKNKQTKPEIEKQSEYYKLKTQAVTDLVEANEENSPQVSEEELRKYRSHSGIKVADWVKMLFIKAWFAGAVCFFFIWGLGGMLGSEVDILFVTGMALGMVNDLLVGPSLRFFEKTPGENARWIMVNTKGVAGLFLNILYGYVELFLVYTVYNVINILANHLMGTESLVLLGVEPILFGVFCLGVDLLLLQIKHLLVSFFTPVTAK